MTGAGSLSTGIETEFRAGALSFRIATQSDDETLRSILRGTPMTSWISLSTEHEPSYFASTRLFGERTAIVSHKNDSTRANIGICSFTNMPTHINGNKDIACYLGELRVLPEFRHKPGIVKNGFRAVENLSGKLAREAYWFTSIVSENRVARRFLEANLKGMPIYRPQGELVTMALSTRTARQTVEMFPARQKDIPELVKFYNRQARQYQYSPVLSEDWLRSLGHDNGLKLQDFYLLKENASIQACFALWDQRSFKQTVVRGYRFPLNILRIPYNLFSCLAGGVRLPEIGSCINYVFIAFLAVSKTAQAQLPKIIARALGLAKLAHADVAMLGLSSSSPYLNLLEAFPQKTYRSHIESVSWPGQHPVRDGLDLSSGHAVIQPEIALL